MPDLSTVLGSSFVPEGGKAFELLQEGVKKFKTRGLAETLAGTPSPEQEKQALIQLSAINQPVAQEIRGILQRNDIKEVEAASKEVRKGIELATRLNRLDFNGKKRLLMEEARLAVAENRDPRRPLDLRGMTKDELRNEIEKMITAGTATETLLKRPAQLAAAKKQQDARDASAILQMTPDKQAIALDTLTFKAEQEGDTDGANVYRQLQRLPFERRQIVLRDTVRQVPQAKPISLGKGARLVDPATGQVIFQPAEAPGGGTEFAKPAVKDFTPESVRIASQAGGSLSDLVIRPEVLRKINEDGRFATGTSVLFKGPKGKLFIGTPVTSKDKDGKPITTTNVVPLTTPTGEEGQVVTRALGETRAEQIAGEVKEAGLKTRAQRLALIETQAGLTGVTKRTERDFVNMDAALGAAENIPQLKRNLELLQKIETGGVDAIILATARTLGVESGDQAELTFNLRTNVLKQLKPTFGAQFTEREGKLLAEIQASETKSTAGNIRLMQRAIEIYDRAIQRGLRAAKRQGDESIVADIEEARTPLEALGEGVGQAAPPAQTGPVSTGQFSNDGFEIFQMPDGRRFKKVPKK